MLERSLLTPSKLPLIEQKQKLTEDLNKSEDSDSEVLVPGRLEKKLEAIDRELSEEAKEVVTPLNLSKKRARLLEPSSREAEDC